MIGRHSTPIGIYFKFLCVSHIFKSNFAYYACTAAPPNTVLRGVSIWVTPNKNGGSQNDGHSHFERIVIFIINHFEKRELYHRKTNVISNFLSKRKSLSFQNAGVTLDKDKSVLEGKILYLLWLKALQYDILLRFHPLHIKKFCSDKTATHLKTSYFSGRMCTIKRRYTSVFQVLSAHYNE